MKLVCQCFPKFPAQPLCALVLLDTSVSTFTSDFRIDKLYIYIPHKYRASFMKNTHSCVVWSH